MKIKLILTLIILLFQTNQILPWQRYELECEANLLLLSRFVLLNQVGIKEKNNKNDGEEISVYLKSVGLLPGYPYCAAGQYYCFAKAAEISGIDAVHIPIKRTGLASEIFNHSKKFGQRTHFAPAIDDLIIWRKGNTPFGHIERIVAVSNKGWVITIGFNTSIIKDNKKIEGVFLKKRNLYHRLAGMAIRGLTGFKINNT